MPPIDLVLGQQPIHEPPVHLVFGDDGGAAPADVEVYLDGALPAPAFEASVGAVTYAALDAVLPGLTVECEARYDSQTQRPTIARTVASWQPTKALEVGAAEHRQPTSARRTGREARWRRAAGGRSTVLARQDDTLISATQTRRAGHQDAARVRTQQAHLAHADALRDRWQSRATRHEDAVAARALTAARWDEMLRRRNSAAGRWEAGTPAWRPVGESVQRGLSAGRGWQGRHQDAWVPQPGRERWPVVVPPRERCYEPPSGGGVHLLFAEGAGTPHLLFVCERHVEPPPAPIVVPIRKVYIVLNSISVRRVDNGALLSPLSLTLTIDADSWTWSWSAQLPATEQALVERGPLEPPVELEAVVNGWPYRLLVEKLARERGFAQQRVRVEGRGLAALLDAPHAPVRSFANTQARTAQQLMADVLTVNGVSIGWDVDWRLTDWLVPAGAWAFQGTHVAALAAIAGAAGGYLQPHPTARSVRVLHRYPVPPWQWAAAPADVELPAAVTSRESIEWIDRPAYNRVYVCGVGQGVLGQVTRAGTAGDLPAPMVTDALITDAAAARQRGIAELGAGGRQALVSLRLPVLPETGLIVPGTMVRYVDGGQVLKGIVRSAQLEVALPQVRQTIGVETHVA